MNTKLFYIIIILLFIGCRHKVARPEKVRKIAVHTFAGKGEHNEIINWFYIKNLEERGFGGFYLESASKVNDFKRSHFIYSKIRPLRFEGQYASGEKIQLLDPNDLPDNILNDSSHLESLYAK